MVSDELIFLTSHFTDHRVVYSDFWNTYIYIWNFLIQTPNLKTRLRALSVKITDDTNVYIENGTSIVAELIFKVISTVIMVHEAQNNKTQKLFNSALCTATIGSLESMNSFWKFAYLKALSQIAHEDWDMKKNFTYEFNSYRKLIIDGFKIMNFLSRIQQKLLPFELAFPNNFREVLDPHNQKDFLRSRLIFRPNLMLWKPQSKVCRFLYRKSSLNLTPSLGGPLRIVQFKNNFDWWVFIPKDTSSATGRKHFKNRQILVHFSSY